MKMKRILIMMPDGLKSKLDALRSRGYTASGIVRHSLEREFDTLASPHAGKR
jgi:hypothetical protein